MAWGGHEHPKVSQWSAMPYPAFLSWWRPLFQVVSGVATRRSDGLHASFTHMDIPRRTRLLPQSLLNRRNLFHGKQNRDKDEIKKQIKFDFL
jgi:hypothetical protein